MSDENAQGTPPSAPGTPPPGEPPSWSAPPAANTPPPPPPDATGAVPAPPKQGGGLNLSVDNPAGLILGLVSVVGVVLGLVLSADRDANGEFGGGGSVKFWDQMGWTWAILGIAAAATTLIVPLLGKSLGMAHKEVVTIVAVAAGVLALWWVLFILPYISSNRAFLATVGVLAAAGAAWVSRSAADRA